MASLQATTQQCSSLSFFSSLSTSTYPAHSPSSPPSRLRLSVKPGVRARLQTSSSITLLNGNADSHVPQRSEIRLGLPSKGRMASDTLELLKDCQLSVRQVNPRQYVADIPQLPNLEVWFQRPKDIVRKLLSGDLDLGIVGLDTLGEYGQEGEDLIVVHDALEYGDCRLSIAIPKYGIFENVNSMKELAEMPQWTAEKPLRVATGFTNLGPRFMKEKGLKHVTFSTADGALEAAPAMGIADAILDLVSSGTTLRENNLKEIEGGTVLESQAVLVARKKSLTQREGVLDATHEILERLEAHLRAAGQFTVVANMRGNSAEEVAEQILSQSSLSGLQGPTISPVYCKPDGEIIVDYYAIVICVPKKALYKSVQQLRAIGGSGVLVSPLTYIFDEEPPRCDLITSKYALVSFLKRPCSETVYPAEGRVEDKKPIECHSFASWAGFQRLLLENKLWRSQPELLWSDQSSQRALYTVVRGYSLKSSISSNQSGWAICWALNRLICGLCHMPLPNCKKARPAGSGCTGA